MRVVIQYGNVFRLNLLFFDAVFLLRSSLVRTNASLPLQLWRAVDTNVAQ